MKKTITTIVAVAMLLANCIALPTALAENGGVDGNTNNWGELDPNATVEVKKELPQEYVDARTKVPLDNTLTVTGGDIRGFHYENGDIQVYQGIPYAEPPIGDLRWTAAREPSPWEGVKDCMEWGASAVQMPQKPYRFWTTEYIITNKTYSEDCLTLNVWTNGSEETKPVLVYIHGGANTSGGSSCAVYEGEELAKKGVVVVTINYRLGAYGFLATEELKEEDPVNVGNYALTDMIQALTWVQANIASFGGDPGNVTIMGQSAGASDVCSIMASPKADGLYHKAVICSGVSTNTKNTTLDEKIAIASEKFAKMAKKDGKDYALAGLRTLTNDDYMNIVSAGRGVNVGTELLPDGLFNRTCAGEEPSIPVMTGMVLGDGTMFGAKGDTPEEIEYNLSIAPAVFSKNRTKGVTYAYVFTRDVPGPDEKTSGPQHTYEVPYFLNILHPVRKDYWQEADRDLAETMSNYLVNFMKNGDPNGEGLTEWTPCGKDAAFLEIDTTCVMKNTPAEMVP